MVGVTMVLRAKDECLNEPLATGLSRLGGEMDHPEHFRRLFKSAAMQWIAAAACTALANHGCLKKERNAIFPHDPVNDVRNVIFPHDPLLCCPGWPK